MNLNTHILSLSLFRRRRRISRQTAAGLRFARLSLSASLFLIGLTAIPIRGQVIIKDTVLISAGQTSKPQGSVLSPTVEDWQLPYRGRLKFNWCMSENVGTLTANDFFQVVSPFERNFQGPSHWNSCLTTYQDEYTTAESYPAGATVSVKLRKTAWDSIPTIFFQSPNSVTFRWTYVSWPSWLYILLNVTVLRDTVVGLIRPDSAVVYPHYPGRNDTVTVGITKRFIDLELRTEYAGTAVPNYWVRLDTAVLVHSGGHSHNGARPMGRYVVPKLDAAGVDTITSGVRKTDSTGVLRFKFLASQFGGVERIRARLLSDTTKFDTLSVKTRVPGLVDFAQIQTNFWDLVGNTGNTQYGPCQNTPIRHYSNHWFDSSYIDSLQGAILDFFIWTGSHGGGGQYLKLGVNDMSLVYGGMFDICANWSPGHTYHRTGNSVDFNTTAVPFGGGASIRLTRGQRIQLESFMRRYAGERYPEEMIHFGFGGR